MKLAIRTLITALLPLSLAWAQGNETAAPADTTISLPVDVMVVAPGYSNPPTAQAAVVVIDQPGYYILSTRVWYNSGDRQQNESFFTRVLGADSTTYLPLDTNAGPYKVVPDDAGPPRFEWRETGIFFFPAGADTLEINHYGLISEEYPEFVHGILGENPESVFIDSLEIRTYRGLDAAVSLTATAPRQALVDGDSAGVVYPGEAYSLRLGVHNLSTDTLRFARVQLELPDSLTLQAVSPQPDERNGRTLLWHLPELAGHDSLNIDLTLQAPDTVAPGYTALWHQARLQAPNDRNLANNVAAGVVYAFADSTGQAPRYADVSLRLETEIYGDAADDGAIGPGDSLRYTLRLRNAGPDSAFAVRLRSSLPAILENIAFDRTPDEESAGESTWHLGDLAPGDSLSLALTAQFPACADSSLAWLIHTAAVAALNDTALANNGVRDSIAVLAPKYDLAVTQHAVTDTSIVVNGQAVPAVRAGGAYSIFLTVINTGPQTACAAQLSQTLPDEVQLIAATLPPTATDSTLHWRIERLAPGDSLSIRLDVAVTDSLPETLLALRSTSRLAAAHDTDAANDTAATIVYAFSESFGQPDARPTDIAITLQAQTDSSAQIDGREQRLVFPGEAFEYQITVTNQGPNPADSVQVGAALQNVLQFLEATPAPLQVTADSLAWLSTGLVSGEQRPFRVQVRLDAAVPDDFDQLIATAWLAAANDSTPENNFAADTLRIARRDSSSGELADVEIRLRSEVDREVDSRVAAPGDAVRYVIEVHNHGPAMAQTLRIENAIPALLKNIVFEREPDVFSGNQAIWTFVSLEPDSSFSFSFSGEIQKCVTAGDSLLVDRARVAAANDSLPQNNFAIDTLRLAAPRYDLSIAQSARTDTVIAQEGSPVPAVPVGGRYSLHLTARNLGPEAACDVRLQQQLPAQVTVLSTTLPPETRAEQHLTWRFERLQPGDSLVIGIELAVSDTLTQLPFALASVAEVMGDFDTNPANNRAEATAYAFAGARTPRKFHGTDLAISLVAETDSTTILGDRRVPVVRPGETFSYQITLQNHGPRAADSVSVSQALQSALVRLEATPEPSAISGDSLRWAGATLAAGAQKQFRVRVQLPEDIADDLQVIISTALLQAANDTTARNNFAADTVFVARDDSSQARFPDVAILQNVATDSFAVQGRDTLWFARPGEDYFYTLTVRNLGRGTARNLRVWNRLPERLQPLNTYPAADRADADSLLWQLDELAPGSSLKFTFEVRVDADLPEGVFPLLNQAGVRAGNEPEDRLQNNSSQSTVYATFSREELLPEINAEPAMVQVNDTVYVRVRVPVQVQNWDIWVYFADGRIDSSYADRFISGTSLTPNYWYDLDPDFTETHLLTPQAKRENIIFELRTLDIFGNRHAVRDGVVVLSANALNLDRNVFEPARGEPLGIRFKLSSRRQARLDVFDLAGRHIAKLAEEVFEADWNRLNWDGMDNRGQHVGSGVYLITLRSGEFQGWKKVIVVR